MKNLVLLLLVGLVGIATTTPSHAIISRAVSNTMTLDFRTTNPLITVGPNAAKATGKKLVLKSQKAKAVKGVAVVTNRGARPDAQLIRGTKGNSFFAVKYTKGGNITGAVTTGKYRTTALSNGQKVPITVAVTPNTKKLIQTKGKTKRYLGKSLVLKITATSTFNASLRNQATIEAKTIPGK